MAEPRSAISVPTSYQPPAVIYESAIEARAGSTIIPTCAAGNITDAIGTPVASDFFVPQN